MKEKYNCRPVGPGLQILLPAWLINITLINSKIELLFEIHVWSISEGIRQLQKRELLSWKTHYRDTSQVYCSPQEFYPNLSWAFTAVLTLSIICRDVCQWECIEKTKNTKMKEDPPNGLALLISIRIHKDHSWTFECRWLAECYAKRAYTNFSGYPLHNEPFKANQRIVVVETWSLRKNKSICLPRNCLWSLLTVMFINHISETKRQHWPLSKLSKHITTRGLTFYCHVATN